MEKVDGSTLRHERSCYGNIENLLLALLAKRGASLPFCSPVLLQLLGVVELEKPDAHKSRLDTWRTQAMAQLLGSYYHCMTLQPIGAGISVLLTVSEEIPRRSGSR